MDPICGAKDRGEYRQVAGERKSAFGAAWRHFVVTDPWQGRGLGSHLMQRLIEVARQRGVKRLIGTVLRENTPMLTLAGELGFTVRPTSESAVVEAVLEL